MVEYYSKWENIMQEDYCLSNAAQWGTIQCLLMKRAIVINYTFTQWLTDNTISMPGLLQAVRASYSQELHRTPSPSVWSPLMLSPPLPPFSPLSHLSLSPPPHQTLSQTRGCSYICKHIQLKALKATVSITQLWHISCISTTYTIIT